MLSWSLVFFAFALIAAAFGFGGFSSGAVGVPKSLFFLFMIAFVVSLILGRQVNS